MLPGSVSAKRAAACAASRNTKLDVVWIGSACSPSALRTWPARTASVARPLSAGSKGCMDIPAASRGRLETRAGAVNARLPSPGASPTLAALRLACSHAHVAHARHRSQELLLLVAPPLAAAQAPRPRVQGDRGAPLRRGLSRRNRKVQPRGPGAGARRRGHSRVGFVREDRTPGREDRSRLAAGGHSPCPGAFGERRDALRVLDPAIAMPDERPGARPAR